MVRTLAGLESSRPERLSRRPRGGGGLVAETFGPSVTTTVLWLRDVGLDIGCVEVSPRSLPEGGYVVTARQLLPLPAAEDYLVKRRRREKAEEEHEASGRRRNTVTILLEGNAIEPGTELRLNLDQFSPEERAVIQPEVENNPEMRVAEWTGLGLRKALRWRADGKVYSAHWPYQTHACSQRLRHPPSSRAEILEGP